MSDPGQPRARTGPVVVAVAYLVNAAVGTWIALRNDIPGRPLGIETGLPIALDFTVGLGTGLSAPLMLLIALALLTGSVARRGRRRSIFWTGILGWCFLVGMLIEPVLGEAMRGEHGELVMAIVVLNVLLPVVLIGLTVGIMPRIGKASAADVVDG